MLIEGLKLPEGLKKLTSSELELVAFEVREKIIDSTSRSGGHLSSSLGAVELTVAIHATFVSPRDKIVWDVGHQSYAHKILTGRLKDFAELRTFGGLSGFPKRGESPHDTFTVGHASTSISQALGIARARDLLGEDFHVIAVLGDGSLSGGLALEGLNNALNFKTNFIVILNDNQLSITKTVGALANYLTKIRTSSFYTSTKERVERIIRRIPRIGEPMVKSIERFKDRLKHFLVDFNVGVILEELGFKYLGPIDGHNIPLVMSTLHFAKDWKGPVFVHVLTKKGKGYKPAEDDPTMFHGTPAFDRATGIPVKDDKAMSYTSVFGRALAKLAEKDDKIVAITAAMLDGTGLEEFAQKFPDRFYDVGIAEEHAVSFASGLASQGLKPVCAIYSTFLQRAYDQIVHDVCLNNLHVVFAVDRGGLVGEDGPTHHGMFDIAYLRAIPNMTVMAPSDENELSGMLSFAMKHKGPISLRYPRGNGSGAAILNDLLPLELGKGTVVFRPQFDQNSILIVAIGSMVHSSLDAAKALEKDGISATVINARFVKPLDSVLILKESLSKSLVVVVEEGVVNGGFGEAVSRLLEENAIASPVKCLGLPDAFVSHGKRSELLMKYGLDPEGISETIKKELLP